MKYNVVWEGLPEKDKKPRKIKVERLPPREKEERLKITDWGFDKKMSEMTHEEYLEYMRIRNRDYYRRNADKVYKKTLEYKQVKIQERKLKEQLCIGLF